MLHFVVPKMSEFIKSLALTTDCKKYDCRSAGRRKRSGSELWGTAAREGRYPSRTELLLPPLWFTTHGLPLELPPPLGYS